MSTASLIEYLRSVQQLKPDIASYLAGQVYPLQFKKGQIMASPGKLANEIWYIESGLAREYSYDASGNMQINAFWKEQELMFIAESFFLKKQSDKYIELLEDSNLLGFGSVQARQLHLLYPEIHHCGYAMLCSSKSKSDTKCALFYLNARERYRRFCESFPWTRISVTDTASYLGLTRETVSKMRSGR